MLSPLAGTRARVATRLGHAASTFDPRGASLAVGRTLVAVAQLSVVTFTSDAGFFPSGVPRCAGLGSLSPWCVAGSSAWGSAAARLVTVLVLALVAVGYRPRLTCIPHWYVTFGLNSAMYFGNGGDQAAVVITLLLIPTCLGDRRRWQWSTPGPPLSADWCGAAYAAHLVLRLQVVLIYGHAVVAKLAEPAWRGGTALHYALQDPTFGAPPAVLSGLEPAWLGGAAILGLTWLTLLTEAALALSPLGNRRVRLAALATGVLLHGFIAAAMGLGSFALIMIGMLTLATGPPRR